jgi:hypothetical protein
MNKNQKLTNTQLSALGVKTINNDEEERAKKAKNKDREFGYKENK